MTSGRFTHAIVRSLNALSTLAGRDSQRAQHLQVGERGEEQAYFYLRRLGYVMVSRNYRSPRLRGEIDLIGWEDGILCFIEVKTRTGRDIKPAEAAVDSAKKREICAVARDYLRRVPGSPPHRFDVLTVYYDTPRPEVTLYRNAFSMT